MEPRTPDTMDPGLRRDEDSGSVVTPAKAGGQMRWHCDSSRYDDVYGFPTSRERQANYRRRPPPPAIRIAFCLP